MSRWNGYSVSAGAKGNRAKPHIAVRRGKWTVTKSCPFGIRNLRAEQWTEQANSHGAGDL